MKKMTLAITALLLLSTPGFAAKTQGVKRSHKKTSCTIKSKKVGFFQRTEKTYELAFQKATGACFQKNSQKWTQSHDGNHPDQDSQIAFVNACVKDIKCQ